MHTLPGQYNKVANLTFNPHEWCILIQGYQLNVADNERVNDDHRRMQDLK